MSQQINLFNPLFRKRGFSFTSSAALLYGLIIATAAGSAAALYQHVRVRQVAAAAQTVEQHHKAMTARFDKIRADLSQQKPNAQLEAQLAELDMQLKGRQEIIETLNSGVVGNSSGFSEYMRAFSHLNVNGLWLTGFEIARGGNDLVIQGRTLSADLVGTYINQLNREIPLQNRPFAAMRINQPPAEPADQTKAETAAAGKPGAGTPAAKSAQDTKMTAAGPRYLEFSISTMDLPDDPRSAGRSAPSLLGRIENSPPERKKTVARQETSR